MVRVKICGIRRAEDAAVAIEAGADALGFNFWTQSPRYISPREAASIIASIPAGVWSVGVFVNEAPQRVREIAAESGISLLQFHGDETPEYWGSFESFERIKAFQVGSGFEPGELARYRAAFAYLLDGSVAGKYGGTGQTFDWSLAETAKTFGKIILAGGLKANNVGNAIRQLQPWAVDVSSGVEIEPGKKDPRLIREFIESVRAVGADSESIQPASAMDPSRRLRSAG